MIEAIAILLTHVFASMLMAVGAVGVLTVGVLKSAWTLFSWPSRWGRD